MTTERTIPLRHAVIVLAGLTVVFGLLIGVLVMIDARDEREDQQAQVDLNYLSCLRGNEVRTSQIENERELSSPLDLTVLPIVQQGGTPDWFEQVVSQIRDLSTAAASAPVDPNSRTGRRIARLESQIRDCEAEWPTHTAGLVLTHNQEAP